MDPPAARFLGAVDHVWREGVKLVDAVPPLAGILALSQHTDGRGSPDVGEVILANRRFAETTSRLREVLGQQLGEAQKWASEAYAPCFATRSVGARKTTQARFDRWPNSMKGTERPEGKEKALPREVVVVESWPDVFSSHLGDPRSRRALDRGRLHRAAAHASGAEVAERTLEIWGVRPEPVSPLSSWGRRWGPEIDAAPIDPCGDMGPHAASGAGRPAGAPEDPAELRPVWSRSVFGSMTHERLQSSTARNEGRYQDFSRQSCVDACLSLGASARHRSKLHTALGAAGGSSRRTWRSSACSASWAWSSSTAARSATRSPAPWRRPAGGGGYGLWAPCQGGPGRAG